MRNKILNGTHLNNAQAYVTMSMKSSLTPMHQAVGFTALRDACLLRSGMTYSTLQMGIDMYQDSMDAVQTSMIITSQFNLQTGSKHDSRRWTIYNNHERRFDIALHMLRKFGRTRSIYYGNNPTSVFSVENAEQTTMLLLNALSLTHVSPTSRQLLAVPVMKSMRDLQFFSASLSYFWRSFLDAISTTDQKLALRYGISVTIADYFKIYWDRQ